MVFPIISPESVAPFGQLGLSPGGQGVEKGNLGNWVYAVVPSTPKNGKSFSLCDPDFHLSINTLISIVLIVRFFHI